MYFVGKITQSRSLHLPKVWMGTRGMMLCVAFFVASQKRPWLGQLLQGSPSNSLTAFLVSVLRGWYLVLPASRWEVRVGRGPVPHLLTGKWTVSSPTALPWDRALALHRRLLSRQNGHTRDTTVLLSPHLSCYRYSILLFRETLVSLCGDP